MIGPAQILDIGKRGLFVHQYALSVTSHNIANLNTPGYSRQRVIFSPTLPLEVPQGYIGTGVEISKIERLRDRLADSQGRDEICQVGEWDGKDRVLKQIEAILNEPDGNGLSQKITEFFNAWMDVANAPEESGPRRVLVEKANFLSNTFHRLKNQLQGMVDDLNEEIKSRVDEINTKVERIAELNVQIVSAEAGGVKKANDLRDARDKLVDEIAELADIQTVEGEDGSPSVYVNYKVIVDRENVVKLETEMVDRGGMKMLDVIYQGSQMVPRSGALKGLAEIRDEEIVNDISDLDKLAKEIIDEVNAKHRVGYGLDGSTGKDFFSGSSADSISVNSEIEVNLSKIAASITGAPGDGDNALQIAELANELTMENDNFTFSDFYRSLVAKIGATSELAGIMKESETALLTQLENYRDSVSGVSIDEIKS